MGHARVPLVSTELFPFLLAIQEPDPNKQISHHLWFQWQARMPSDSLIECTLQDRIEVGWLRHEFYPRGQSPHNPKLATVSIIVGLNTVALSSHWVFRAVLALCSHGIRLSLFKNCEACEGSHVAPE